MVDFAKGQWSGLKKDAPCEIAVAEAEETEVEELNLAYQNLEMFHMEHCGSIWNIGILKCSIWHFSSSMNF